MDRTGFLVEDGNELVLMILERASKQEVAQLLQKRSRPAALQVDPNACCTWRGLFEQLAHALPAGVDPATESIQFRVLLLTEETLQIVAELGQPTRGLQDHQLLGALARRRTPHVGEGIQLGHRVNRAVTPRRGRCAPVEDLGRVEPQPVPNGRRTETVAKRCDDELLGEKINDEPRRVSLKLASLTVALPCQRRGKPERPAAPGPNKRLK